MFVVFSWYSGFLYLKILSKVVLKILTLNRTLNKPESCIMIDWCLTPTFSNISAILWREQIVFRILYKPNFK